MASLVIRYPTAFRPDPNRIRPGLEKTIATAILHAIQDHFEQLNLARHEHGVTGFYEEARRGTFYTEELGYPAVVTNKLGIRLRLYGTAGLPGGVLKPRPGKKYLTIPARDEAFGQRAVDMVGLRLVYGRQRDGNIGPVALAGDALGVEVLKSTRGKEKWKKIPKSRGTIFFWLRKSVFQRPDPTVVPTNKTLEDEGTIAARLYLDAYGQ